MKKILAIFRKDLFIRFSSKLEWLFFLILPIVFTFALGSSNPQGDNRVRLVVVDQANTPLSQELISTLENSESVRPELAALEKAESEFYSRRVSALLIIPAGFNQAQVVQGSAELELRQQPNSQNALAVERAVQAVISRVGRTVDIANNSVNTAEKVMTFANEEAKQDYFIEALIQAQKMLDETPDRVDNVLAVTADPIDYDPKANSSAGQLVTWVFIPLFGISALFAYERQQGTLRRLLTTPTEKPTFLLGAISGQVATALVQMLILVIFGILVMKLPWGQNPPALAIMLVTSALAAAAFGTTLGTFIKTESQASNLSIMLGMSMALLGGCWYPLELFPPVAQQIAHILPTTWAMQGLLDIVMRGGGVQDIALEACVLTLFAVIFFVVGVWRFRYE
jgi:ABC-2 type transport system permease protein